MKAIKKKLCLIEAGGTIDAVQSLTGLRADKKDQINVLGTFRKQRPEINEVVSFERSDWHLNTLSENMSRGGHDWEGLAQHIADQVNRHRPEGVVVTHGTDTMEYTSAALSFLLRDVSIPIVMTGSNYPITDTREDNDAFSNLFDSCIVAATSNLSGVFVVFNHLVLSGTRVVKLTRWDNGVGFFECVGSGPVGRLKGKCYKPEKQDTRKRHRITRNISSVGGFLSKEVTFFCIKPDRDPEDLSCLLESENKIAVLLELYNSGTGPTSNAGEYSLLPVLEHARNKGILVFATTRGSGRMKVDAYSTSRELCDAGVIPLSDMTTSSAWVKLRWVLAQTKKREEVIKMMLSDIAGELTEGIVPIDISDYIN